MEKEGYLFDIQSFSVHDGPGCRTNVFFSGCPLQCRWCANPESWIVRPHLLFAEAVCKGDKGCQACAGTCPNEALTLQATGKPRLDWEICQNCTTFSCIELCPNKALKQCVKTYTVVELLKLLRRDFNHWGPTGGVTFSGGEPLLQADFLLAILAGCRRHQIHTAIETSAYAKQSVFLAVLEKIDFAFIDVKHMEEATHRQGTGVSNQLILDNIAALKPSGWQGRLVLRQPTIAGYNDSVENALHVIDFMKQHDLYEINLLKFHRFGATKWQQLGKNYEFMNHGDVTEETLYNLQNLYLNHDIACYIGDDTPF
ncbi:MAG: 4-hydroxyphenylacetate decarboxylase activase [Sporomusaceae bacterium]|nr:4-hydroxyphenylacetate decarboxylase activase [Sporomusaceae bacterium]